MPAPVEQFEPEGIDYAWIMQMTFILTILLGAPILAILSTFFALATWGLRVQFAIGFGAVIWFIVAISVYYYERSRANTV